MITVGLNSVFSFFSPKNINICTYALQGRVARAGRLGTAYSLVVTEEMPYLLDLHLFLGKPLQYASESSTVSGM